VLENVGQVERRARDDVTLWVDEGQVSPLWEVLPDKSIN
jgi:hypothetical protein